jgi:2-dehydropantoate 2-reductase
MQAWTFAVLGPGGVGGLLGGLLARQGHRVICLAGETTVAALREKGLRVRSPVFGEFAVPVEASMLLSERVDACLVTVKATQLHNALERLPPNVLGTALIVPFLNGVEHVAALRQRYPAEQVVPATMRVESARVGPGEIEHASPFAAIEVATSGRPLAAHLRAAGLQVTERTDEAAMLWDKLSFLGPLALVTTHARAPVGVVRIERRDDLLAVIGEYVRVARAHGAEIDQQAIVAAVDRLPAAMTSSMQRDAEAARPTELDAIGTALLRAATRTGTATPTTARLVADLRMRL